MFNKWYYLCQADGEACVANDKDEDTSSDEMPTVSSLIAKDL